MIKKRKKSSRLVSWIFIAVLISGLGLVGHRYYRYILAPNISLPDHAKTTYLYIHTGSDFQQLINTLTLKHFIRDTSTFTWVATKMNFTEHIHAGRFLIKNKMSNYELVRMLRANLNVPVSLVFNDQKTVEDLAGYIGSVMEIDSVKIMKQLFDSAFLKNNQLTKDNVLTFFIPNTYQVYWNISIEDFMKKMGKEYDRFWNDSRLRKAKKTGLTPAQVTILASIVEGETNRSDEMARIAGVYLNRLKIDMRLEADPTVAFQIKTRKVKRVYGYDLNIDSPYNTYKHKGLPPGPIGFSQIRYIDAVLNAEKHNFIYFCAKPDNSGSHNFSKTEMQHRAYARMYQRYLDSLNIR